MLALLNTEPLLVSTGIVALAEVGDKTQLLSLILAARFRKPWPIILGILLATLANHSLAAALGTWITHLFSPDTLTWIVGLSFIAMAFWMLIPDTCDESDTDHGRFGVLGATLMAFFLAEMGDKTQIATIALAAQYNALPSVVAGTTLGMMIANVPVVFLGEKLAHRLPVRPIHLLAALVFAALGIFALAEAGDNWQSAKIFVSQLRVIHNFDFALLLDSGLALLAAALLGGLQCLDFRAGWRSDHGPWSALMALAAAAFVDVAARTGGAAAITPLMGYWLLLVGLLGAGILARTGIRPQSLERVTTLLGASAIGIAAGAGWIGEALEITGGMLAITALFRNRAAGESMHVD